jgi:hypothetical protein
MTAGFGVLVWARLEGAPVRELKTRSAFERLIGLPAAALPPLMIRLVDERYWGLTVAAFLVAYELISRAWWHRHQRRQSAHAAWPS